MTGSSKRVIRTVLGEPLAAWYSEGTHLGCECGRRLTLADRLDQQAFGGSRNGTRAAKADLAAEPLRRERLGTGGSLQPQIERKGPPRIDDLLSIIALGACLTALAACAMAYYL